MMIANSKTEGNPRTSTTSSKCFLSHHCFLPDTLTILFLGSSLPLVPCISVQGKPTLGSTSALYVGAEATSLQLELPPLKLSAAPRPLGLSEELERGATGLLPANTHLK